jgi:hypothetical protein
MDAPVNVSIQIFASNHEVTSPDIRDGDPLPGAQGLAACSPRALPNPFPASDGFRAEASVAQEPKLPAAAAFGVEHLEASEVGVQDRHDRVENLLVQRLDPAAVDRLCGNLLKPLRGVKFTLATRLVGVFRLRNLFPPALLRF